MKVADFGLARDVFEKDYYRSEARRPLPYKWMAPECIDFQKFDSRSDVVRFRNKTRISFYANICPSFRALQWSFGVTLWEVMTRGCKPYEDIQANRMIDYLSRGHRLKKPPHCDQEM